VVAFLSRNAVYNSLLLLFHDDSFNSAACHHSMKKWEPKENPECPVTKTHTSNASQFRDNHIFFSAFVCYSHFLVKCGKKAIEMTNDGAWKSFQKSSDVSAMTLTKTSEK